MAGDFSLGFDRSAILVFVLYILSSYLRRLFDKNADQYYSYYKGDFCSSTALLKNLS